jgi:antitoxin (DNA-binding transcriptional repressor) of toxin-antitoxin stability system
MSEHEIGVEAARAKLGDLVDSAALDGTVTYLTRRGRPYAAIAPLHRITKEPTMPIAPLTEGTLAAIANIVDATIDKEYGVQGAEVLRLGAAMIAQAGLHFDLREAYLQLPDNRGEQGLAGLVETELRMRVAEGLEARTCQCRQIQGVCRHSSNPTGLPCAGHYEADVPPIRGLLLCGPCHADEYEAQ